MAQSEERFRPTLSSVQGLRGLALLLVMLVHQSFVEQKYGHVPPMLVKTHLEQFNHVAVDTFFVISGFIIAYTTTYDGFGGVRNAMSFLYRRLTRIFPPWWLYSATLLPVYFIAPQLINATENHQVDLVRSFLLLPSDRLPIIPIGWTLTYELYFYLGFALLVMLPRRYLGPTIALWGAIMIAFFGLRATGYVGGATFKLVSNPICIEFLFGVVVAMLLDKGPAKRPRLLVVVGVLWWLLGYAAYVHFLDNWLVDIYSRVVVFGIPAGLVVYGMVSLEAVGASNPIGRFKWLGDISYSTYLCHVMVVVVIGRIWYVYGPDGYVAHWLWLFGSVGVALLLGALSYEYVEKPILRWAKRHDPTIPSRPAQVVRPA